MIKILSKFWRGDIELKKSFWLGLILVGAIAGLQGLFIIEPTPNNISLLLLFYVFYLGYLIFLTLFLYIGVWRSAENYKKKRKKKFWAIVAQIFIISQAIFSILFFFN